MRRFLPLLLLVGILSLAGCADASSPPAGSAPASADTSVPADDPHAGFFDGDQLYAAAYVGYEELWDLSFFREAGLIDGTPPIHHVSGGEYYLVIPRYPDMNLQLFRNLLRYLFSLTPRMIGAGSVSIPAIRAKFSLTC